MTETHTHDVIHDSLYRAAARATLAPSIHNSQPWRFVLGADSLDIYADTGRAVPVIDPTGRQRLISCGAAVFGATLSLAAAGLGVSVALLPDGEESELVARVTVTEQPDPSQSGLSVADARRLDTAAALRRSNRRQFDPEPVAEPIVEALRVAAEQQQSVLHPVIHADDRRTVARLLQRADTVQSDDPAYKAELRAWTSDDPARTDGVPAASVPHAGQGYDDVPIREFDLAGDGGLPAETHSSLRSTLAVITTAGDRPQDWLEAGAALYRVLLELTDAGYVASLFSQVCEVPALRAELRSELRLAGNPQILLRAGRAAATTPTPRRPLDEVITA